MPLAVAALMLALLAGTTYFARAHVITVNGVSTEWFTRAPLHENTGLVARNAPEEGEYIWSDRAADERTDFASPDQRVDMTQVRYTATATNFHALVKLAALQVSSGNGAPMIQLAIDTDGVAGSGEPDLVAGADTRVADVAEWEYLLQTRFGSGAGTLNVWQGGAPIAAGAVAQGGDGTVELTIPWSALGLVGPPSAPLQITAATFRSTAADQTQDVGGPGVSDALDVVTDYGDPRTSGYPNTSAEVSSDQTIDYFSQIYFNAAGEVRAPVVISKAATNLGATPGAEWIQVTNTTASPVNISGYAIGDEESPDGGEGMYQFPAGTTLPVGGSARIARSATAYFSVFATNPQFELMSTDPAVPDLISFANWGSTVPDFGDAGDEALLLDSSPSTQIDVFTNGTGAYSGVVSRAAPGSGEIVTRAASLRDTDNNINDFSLSACAGTIVFDGGPSGTGTSWHTAANWRDTTTNADRLPTTTDHVCIPDLGIAGVLFDSGTTSVLSVAASETLTINAGTLNITSTSQASEFGTFNLTGGALGGAGSFTVNGPTTWSNAAITADTTVATGTFNGAVTMSGSDHHFSARQLAFNADATWTGGRILMGFDAGLTNGAGHTFAVQTGADFQHWGGGATFTNNGVIAKSIDTTITDVPSGIVFNNPGSVNVTTGTLDFGGGGASPGSFNVGAGAGLAFSGNTQTLAPASTVSGAGSLSFMGGTTNVNGTYTHTGPVSVSGSATANFSPALNNNPLSVSAGTLNVNASSNAASLSLGGGTIGGAGNLTVTGPTVWSGGGFAADNTSVKTTFNGAMTMDGSDHQVSVRRLELNGATTWTAARILIGFGGTMVNNPTGVFTAAGEADFQHWGGIAGFDNLGTLNKDGAGTTTTFPGSVVLNNAGSVHVPHGVLEIGGGGTSTGSFAVPAGSTLRFDGGTNNLSPGSTLSGSGSLAFASGTTNVNGTYTHTGPLSVSGSATANFSPALNNSPLTVSSGTLNLNSASSVPSLSLAGTIGGAGNLTVNGPTAWSNGGFAADNTSVKTTFNGPVTMDGSDHQVSVRRLELNGATTWTAARILIGFGGTMVNNPTGVFTAAGEADFQHWGGIAGFDNLGTLNKEGAGTTTTFPGSVPLNNFASTVVGHGQLELAGGGTSTGSFSVPAGSTLRFDGGTHTLNLGSSITGAGTVRFASGTVNSVGDYNVPNLTDVTNGTVNFNLSSFADETPVTVGTMTQSGGVVGGTDTLDITGSFTWSAGTQTGTGQTVILPAATLALTGAGKTLSGLRTLLNQGTTNWLDSAIWHVGGGSPSGGTILNEGTWNIGDGQGINQNGGQMEFRNAPGGVVNKITTPGGQASNWSGEDGAGSADGGIVASIPGWSRTSNATVVQYGSPGFPTVGQAPPAAGSNFFAGGPTTALSSITQNIDIAPFASAIDSGDFTTFLEGYLGGTGAENDNMTVRAVFLSGATELGSVTLAPVLAADRGNTTGFVFRSTSGAVPPGTRTVRLEQIANRATGGTTYNNAYSDKIKIRFRSSDAFVGSSYLDIPFDNDSTATGGGVHVQHGTFNLAEGGLNSNIGSFSVDDGGSLQLSGGNHSFAAASTLTGAGTAQFSGGTATILGTYNPTRTNIDGGTATFNAPATTTVLNQSSGTLSGSSSFTINGPSPASSWESGTMTGSGTTRLVPGATMNLSGGGVKDASGGRITLNEGTWNFAGTGDMRSATSTFQNSGVFDVRTDSDFQNNLGGTGQFNNTGTLKKTVGSGTSFFSMGVDNDGSLLANTGTFELRGGDGGESNVNSGSYSVPSILAFNGGTHDLAAASSVSGAGTARFESGAVNVLGTYNPTKTEISGGAAVFDSIASTTQLDLSSGILAGAGTFTINGPTPASIWTGGTMTGTGTTRLVSGATMNLSSAGVKDASGGRITLNEGTWNFAGTGDMRSGTSTFNNAGVFDVQTDNDFQNNLGGTGQFNNTATLKKTVGSGTTFFSMAVDNDGSLLANTGTFELRGGDGGESNFNSGSYSAPSILAFNGGTHDLAAASSVSGTGTARFESGAVNVLGAYNPTRTEITGGTAAFGAAASTAVLDLSGGSLAGAGTFTINGPTPASSWTGGTMTGTGTTRLVPGATMNLSGGGVKDLSGGRITQNEGTWNFAGTNDMRSGTSTFNNAGVFDVQTDSDFHNNLGGTGQFNNTGLLKKTVGSATTLFSTDVNNQAGGTLLVQSGTFNPASTFTNAGIADVRSGAVLLSNSTFTNFAGSTLTGGTYLVAGTFRFNSANIVNNAATIVLDGAASAITDTAGTPLDGLRNFATNAAAGDFTVKNGRNLFTGAARGPNLTNNGVLRGTGIYFQNVTNNGTLAPGASPGILTVDGTYTQTAGGTLEIEVAGTGIAGTDYDRLVVTGTATLAGTITGAMLGGFAPTTGIGIDVVTAAARSQTFGLVGSTPSPLPGNLLLEARYDPTTVKLFAVPGGGAADDSVAEAAGVKTITVTLSAPSSEPITVNYATADGSAKAPSDYQSTTGTLNFAANDTSETFDVAIVGDARDEPAESFLVNLSGPVGTVLTDVQATITITDDDAPPTVSIGDLLKGEGTGGTTPFNLQVSLSGPSGNTVTTDFATVEDTATEIADYVEQAGTVTFAPGETTKTVTVQVEGDPNIELDERLFVDLSNPTNASILKDRGIVTIVDDDQGGGGGASQLSINDVSIDEIDTEGAAAEFTVTLSPAPSTPVSVHYSTIDGSAKAGDDDYTPTTGTLMFGTTDSTKSITVPITGDNLDEGSEGFSVVLSSAVGASLNDAVGAATVQDDDATPVVQGSDATTDEDEELLFGLTGTDGDEDSLTFEITSPPSHGSASIGAGNVVSYQPDANFNGDDSFSFRAFDGTNFSEPKTVNIDVVPVNDDPVAVSEDVGLAEDGVLEINVLANDTDVDGADLFLGSVDQPEVGGTVAQLEGGVVRFTAAPNFSGFTEFTYTVEDGDGGSAPATVFVFVSAVNDRPVAEDQVVEQDIDEDSVDNEIVLEGSDVEDSSLEFRIIDGPSHGELAVTDGDNLFLYTPSPNYFGVDSFRFVTSDGELDSAPATVQITVDPVNDLPVPENANVVTVEGQEITFTLHATDVDDDVEDLQFNTTDDQPEGGTVSIEGNEATYTPDSGFTGDDSFTFSVTDDSDVPVLGTVNLRVLAAGDGGGGPVSQISIDDPSSHSEGDSPADGGVIFTVTIAPVPATPASVHWSTASGTAVEGEDFEGNQGDIIFGPDGSAEIRVDFNGDNLDEALETFSVNLSNPTGASLTKAQGVGLIDDDDATPVVEDQSVTVSEDDSVEITLTGTDEDDASLHFDTLTMPAHGEFADVSGLVYVPDPDFHGTDSFTFRADDESNRSEPATVHITVTPANDPPIVQDDSVVTVQNASRNIKVLENDTDIDGDTLHVDDVSDPEHGTASTEDGNTVDYQPDPGFAGFDEFEYTVTDGSATQTGTVTVEVLPAGDDDITTASIVDVAISESDDEAVFTLVLSNSANGSRIHVETDDDTAKGGSDYFAAGTTFTFNGGATSHEFAVKLADDALDENDERFRVNITVESGGVVTPDSVAFGNIADDDPLTGVSAGTVDVVEGNSGSTTVNVPVSLSAPSGKTVSVDFATGDGEAAVGADYTANEGTVTFAAGETSKSIPVVIAGDGAVEFDETVNVTLTNPENASVLGSGAVRILNDDSLLPPPPPPPPAPVTPTADLALTMTGPATSAIDRAVTYNLGVRNNGPNTATGVVVTDTLPGGLQLVSANVGGVACSGSAVVTCPIGTLASGATAAVTVIATTTEPGVHTNTAAVSGQQADPAAGNNSANATTRVPVPVLRETERAGGCTQRGTAGDDVLRGGPGVDVLCGLGGNDVLIGFGGNDRLIGGAGNDRILGGPGNDNLKGGTGSDNLLGGAGNDRLDGGRGRDTLAGERGNDTLLGSFGNDFLNGGKGKDRNLGGPGNDRMRRDAQDASLGGPGRDRCIRSGVTTGCP